MFKKLVMCLLLSSVVQHPSERVKELVQRSISFKFDISKNEKIKIGVIDVYPVKWTESSLKYKSSIQISKPKVVFIEQANDLHGEAVISEMVSIFEKYKVSNVEIIYCQMDETLSIENCLSQFKSLNLTAINISMIIPNLKQSEKDLLLEVSEKTKIIVSAGNDSADASQNELCSYRLKNKICVGGISLDRKSFDKGSNYGSSIDAVDYYRGSIDIYDYFRYDKRQFVGTSASAPRFLASSIVRSLQ